MALKECGAVGLEMASRVIRWRWLSTSACGAWKACEELETGRLMIQLKLLLGVVYRCQSRQGSEGTSKC